MRRKRDGSRSELLRAVCRSLAPGSLNSRFSSRRRGLFGSTSTAWTLGLELQLSAGHFRAERLCARARSSDGYGPFGTTGAACRVVVAFRTVCASRREPEDGKWTVLRVCSHCACLSAHLFGVELVVRRDSARTVLTTVTNAGGGRVASRPRHMCVIEKLRGVPMFSRCLC